MKLLPISHTIDRAPIDWQGSAGTPGYEVLHMDEWSRLVFEHALGEVILLDSLRILFMFRSASIMISCFWGG